MKIKSKGYKVKRKQKTITYSVKPYTRKKGKLGNNQWVMNGKKTTAKGKALLKVRKKKYTKRK